MLASPVLPAAGLGASAVPIPGRSTRSIAGAAGPEEELWRGTPSAKALLGAILGTLLIVTLVPLLAYFVYPLVVGAITGLGRDASGAVARNRGTLDTVMLLLVIAIVAARVLRLAWRLAVLKSHRYRVTNQRIIAETGVFSKRIEEIDMRLIDDFQLQQNFLERILRIGDITILSSDRTAAQLVLRGLPRPRELRELIRNSAYGATRGQLFTRET
jgi:uncharacterized membrane protein YdbT with pleckstrin-like domain